MNDKIAVKIILDPDNEKIDNISLLQILNKSGMNIPFHCIDGYCGTCKVGKPLQDNSKVKEGKDTIAFFDESKEMLPCVTVLDRNKSEINKDGFFELKFLLPKEYMGSKLEGRVKENEIWVFDFANKKTYTSLEDWANKIDVVKIKNKY